MAEKTLYDILELSRSASADSIRAAYDRLSEKFDPEVGHNSGDAETKRRYEGVKSAFLVLGNVQKRATYDKGLDAKDWVAEQERIASRSFWTVGRLAILAVLVLSFSGYYYKTRQEEIRLEAAKIMAAAKVKEAEQNAKAEAEAAEAARLEYVKQRQQQYADERQRRESEMALRGYSGERRAMEIHTDLSQRQERRESEQSDRQRQAEEMRAAAAARQQLARDKAELCRIERERYGRAVSC
jgi:curved DNA-binding protein CbpA